MKRISDAIDGLRVHSARLNQLTDDAAKVIKQVEDFLNVECSAGVFARVVVSRIGSSDDEYQNTGARYLAYCRVGPRFRIAVDWAADDNPSEPDPKAWSDCKRDDKLESLEKLPELIAEISKELGDRVKKVEESLEVAKAVKIILVGEVKTAKKTFVVAKSVTNASVGKGG